MPLQNFGICAYDETPGRSFHLYRSAQPDPESFDMLRHVLGIKTIFKLSFDDEGMTLVQEQEAFDPSRARRVIGCQMPKLFREHELQDVLNIVQNIHGATSDGPVLVHCKCGTDRTGLISSCYRMIHCKEPFAEAMANRAAFGVNWIRDEFDFEDHPVFTQVQMMIADGRIGGTPACPAK